MIYRAIRRHIGINCERRRPTPEAGADFWPSIFRNGPECAVFGAGLGWCDVSRRLRCRSSRPTLLGPCRDTICRAAGRSCVRAGPAARPSETLCRHRRSIRLPSTHLLTSNSSCNHFFDTMPTHARSFLSSRQQTRAPTFSNLDWEPVIRFAVSLRFCWTHHTSGLVGRLPRCH